MTELDLAPIKARVARATPGPWIDGNRWFIAGVIYKDGTCAYCARSGPVVWEGLRDINGTRMQAHVHQEKKAWYGKGHELYSYDGGPEPEKVAGNYDYESGGIVSPRDATFIAHAREDIPALVAEVERLREELSKHR